jgi:hypothetical protein
MFVADLPWTPAACPYSRGPLVSGSGSSVPLLQGFILSDGDAKNVAGQGAAV